MHLIKRIAFLCVVRICMQSVAAQSISLPYFNGWEDEAENGQWIMNSGMNGPVTANRWYVSTKESFSGAHSLLISDLSVAPDTSAVYSSSTVSIVAARTIQLPRGTYDLSFAWRSYGEEGKDGLYVAWVDNMADISTSTSMMHSWVETSQPYRGRMFYGSSRWQVETVSITSQGVPMKLVFLWTNDGTTANNPSVCIDDIQISRNSCGRPSGIKSEVTDDDVTLSWTANEGAEYEVRYDSQYAQRADTVKGVRGGEMTVEDLPNGVYNFYVRVICAPGDTSIWYPHLGVVVNAGLCLDYTNLEGEGVTCYLSSEEENPYQSVGVDRNGIDGAPSRHTVNTERGEVDPYTGGVLRVIPDGEFVSVRLGNERPGGAEAIEYSMNLDSGSNIVLLMKYSVVLEVPNHKDENMPKFHLEIVDENGILIDPTCGQIDFYATMDLLKEGWHESVYRRNQNDPIIFKEWTTIGINLTDYAVAGDAQIKIRLATNDCTEGAHFGYAYFTLSCTEAKIEGLTCGDYKTEEISAPEGFNYRWYKTYWPEEEIAGADERTLDIEDNDTTTYSCDVISKENEECFFTLSASLMPRFPKAKFEPEWCPEECMNAVRLENLSYVETMKGVSDEVIEEFEWNFGDGVVSEERSPVISVPNDGDTLHVTLRASISGGMCYDEWDTTVVVPPVGDVFDTTFVNLCKGGAPYIINGVPYTEEGDYPLPPSVSYATGCDSIHVVSIKVTESYESEIDTAICYGDTLYVGESKFFFSGDFTERVNSTDGCDSTIHVRLDVRPEVTFSVDVQNAASGPNSGRIVLKDTLPGTYYTLNGELDAPLDSLPEGRYVVVCYNDLGCESEALEVEIVEVCADVEVGKPGEICADDGTFYLPVTVTDGKVSHCNLRFGDMAVAACFTDADSVKVENGFIKVVMPDSVRPDNYEMDVEVVDYTCGGHTWTVPFTVLYPVFVMKQKWNNVIALKNADYNGGYDFTAYRWYLNGDVMADETGSYIYLGEGEEFNPTDEYRAELTRADDGVTLMTCPFHAEWHEDMFPYPQQTVVGAMQRVEVINVTRSTSACLWTVGGVYLGCRELDSATPYFITPRMSGVYILLLDDGEDRRAFKILVR